MDIQEIREPEAQSLGTKKKRKSLAKVRTGCKTCKIRRVKCDETRPVCQRCLKWGGASICDGYEDLVPTRTFRAVDLKAAHRPLLPNPKPLCRSPNVQKFDSDEEYSFFQRFCVESTVQLSGSRYSELWNRVVLQGSEMEACVRHAVVAIGALDFHKLSHGGTDLQSIHREFTFREYGALTAVGMMNASPWSKKVSDEDRMGRKIAYEEYGKAIKCLRKAVMEKRSDIMTRLTSCLLFILFEVYHGNNESAAAQTHAGIKMMEEHSKQRSEWTPSLGTIRPPPIDREIVETFALLEIQATGWSDNNRPDMHLAKIYAGEAIEDIPYEFKTLKHAAFVLSTIMLRGAHLRFVRRTPPYIAPEEIVTALTTLEPVYTVGPEHAEFCNVLNRFQQWKAAFEPLFRRARTESGKHLKKGAITLKIHYLSSYLWTASGAPLPEMYYRRHTKELAEVISLAELLLNDSSIKNESYLDLRIVLPLMIAGWYYRHRKVRQEVIAIFKILPKRDGLWDASLLGKIFEWMVELEEEGMTEGDYVPIHNIANVTNLQIDAPNRTAFVEAVQAEGGEMVTRSKTLNW